MYALPSHMQQLKRHMFNWRKGKRKSELSLFDYYIQLNERSINNWIGTDAEIGCKAKWTANDSSVVDHIINYLPKACVHFHRTPGVFSESVAGGYRSRDDVDIEWGLKGGHFIVWLPIEDKTLFCCPIARAGQMLSSGDNASRNLRGESNLIDIELG
jgi:hypothetical protein